MGLDSHFYQELVKNKAQLNINNDAIDKLKVILHITAAFAQSWARTSPEEVSEATSQNYSIENINITASIDGVERNFRCINLVEFFWALLHD